MISLTDDLAVMKERPNVGAVEGLDRFTASGAMNYPDGAMKFIWDGRGTRGPSASCEFAEDGVRIRPVKPIRSVVDWPELLLPREEIELVERVFFGRYRFRVTSPQLNGACFRPTGNARGRFLAGLEALQIPVVQTDSREKLRFERHTLWNQVRWGGRLRRRHQQTTD